MTEENPLTMRSVVEARLVMDGGLKRATDLEEVGRQECGVCLVPFDVEAVQLQRSFDGSAYDVICPPCIEHLGRRNPTQFPTIEEYEKARRCYSDPVFDYYEASDGIWRLAYDASWIDRDALTANA